MWSLFSRIWQFISELESWGDLFSLSGLWALSLVVARWLFEFGVQFLPDPMSDTYEAVLDSLETGAIPALFRVVGWLIDFVIPIDLVDQTLGLLVIVWNAAFLVRLLFWFKGHVWAGGTSG